MKLYISGPMRGYPRFNFDAFHEAAAQLEEAGYQVFSPAQHDIDNGFDPDAPLGEDFDLRSTLANDLLTVTTWADGIALLPGWQHSSGARAELAAAAAVGLKAGLVDVIISATDAEDPFYPAQDYLDQIIECDIRALELAGVISSSFADRVVADSGEVRMVSKTGGEKGSKLARFDLLPTDALWLIAEHFGKGAAKYADRNWERGYEWSLSYAALLRHLTAWWGGEDIDEETDSTHLAAAGFHVLALLHFEANEPYRQFDNRPGATD